MRCWLPAAVAALTACSGTGGDDGNTIEPFAEATITLADASASAAFEGRKAFGLAIHEQGLIYLASGSGATCASITDYFTSKDPFDPTDILPPETCNIQLAFQYDKEVGWDGLTFQNGDIGPIWAVGCAMNPGQYNYENKDGDRDYYYSGRVWQGNPTQYTATLGGSEQSLSIDLTMSDFSGNMIYEFVEMGAEGQLETSVDLEWCSSFVNTPFFTL